MDGTKDSWKTDQETRHLRPVVAMPPIKGGIKVARMGASIETNVRGKRMRMPVRERAAYLEARVVARCLGMRDGPRMMPCSICQECPAEGEDGLDGLRRAHPTPMQLKKAGEQHVFALYSEDLIDPDGHETKMRAYKDAMEALAACEAVPAEKNADGKITRPYKAAQPLERQALVAHWGGYPREPWAEPIGLMTDEQWNSETDMVEVRS